MILNKSKRTLRSNDPKKRKRTQRRGPDEGGSHNAQLQIPVQELGDLHCPISAACLVAMWLHLVLCLFGTEARFS